MQRHGFIHDMMDVKVLILYVMARTMFPLSDQEIYELCYQDECLSYFDVCTAIPQLVESGHLEAADAEKYRITEKGREQGEITQDTVAFTVRRRAETAVEKFNRERRRLSKLNTQLLPRENGEFGVVMEMNDEVGSLMKLELMATSQQQAIRLAKQFEKRAELLYELVVETLWDEADESGQ